MEQVNMLLSLWLLLLLLVHILLVFHTLHSKVGSTLLQISASGYWSKTTLKSFCISYQNSLQQNVSYFYVYFKHQLN